MGPLSPGMLEFAMHILLPLAASFENSLRVILGNSHLCPTAMIEMDGMLDQGHCNQLILQRTKSWDACVFPRLGVGGLLTPQINFLACYSALLARWLVSMRDMTTEAMQTRLVQGAHRSSCPVLYSNP